MLVTFSLVSNLAANNAARYSRGRMELGKFLSGQEGFLVDEIQGCNAIGYLASWKAYTKICCPALRGCPSQGEG